MPAYGRSILLLASVFAAAMPMAISAQPVPGPGYVLRTLDGDNDLGEHFALVPRATADTWVGFFYMADERRLFSADCSGLSCTINRPMTLTGGHRGQHVSAAPRPAASNNPVVAYYNATDGDLMLTACVDNTCAINSVESTLDAVGDVGVGTAIAVDPATGFPAVAYYDLTNGDLKVYRCGSADCSTGSAVIADGVGNRGRNPAIAFGSGAMWVTYDDTATGEVRLAFSISPFSTFSGFSLGAGTDAALTMDASGFPDVVFRTTVSDALQRVRCTNATCSNSTQQTLAGNGRGFAPSATRLPNGNLLVSHQEQSTGTVYATVCNDTACSAPITAIMDSRAGFGATSVALAYANARPLVLFRDATRADVRAAQCTTAACTDFQRRLALNGVVARNARVALHSDGRAVSVWQRTGSGLQVALATCADALCSTPVRRQLLGGNGGNGSRPAVAIRPDGRPFAFYTTFGGTQAFDCADPECITGTVRTASGFGSGTSNFSEMALRADGRPVLVYYRGNTNDLFAFICADVNCSSGTERLVSNELDQSVESTQLANFSVAIGPGDRLIVVYSRTSQPTPGNFVGAVRFVRCDDAECNSATARTVGNASTFFATPMAIRSDGRPVFVEFTSSPRTLAICDDADCTAVTRFTMAGIDDRHSSLGLRAGNVPVFDGGNLASIGYWACSDSTCGQFQRSRAVIDTTTPNRQLYGPLALNASGQPFLAAEENETGDVFLAVPLREILFANGFEP